MYDTWAIGEYFHLSEVDRVAQLGYTWHTDMKVCALHPVETDDNRDRDRDSHRSDLVPPSLRNNPKISNEKLS